MDGNGDAMEAGGALDATSSEPDVSVLRALTLGHVLLFGTIGCVLTALVAAASGYVTFASGALPRWTGWVAYAVAVLNLASVPTMFGGTSSHDFFSAGGPAVAAPEPSAGGRRARSQLSGRHAVSPGALAPPKNTT